MAIPIQDGGLIATRLQTLLRTQGRMAPSLEEFVIPTIQVANLSDGGMPAVVRHASVRWDVGAVVGEFFVMRLAAPPGLILLVDRFDCTPIAGGTLDTLHVHFGGSVGAPGTALTSAYTDSRVTQASELPGAVVEVGTQIPALAASEWQGTLPGNTGAVFKPTRWIVGSGNTTDFGFLEFLVTQANRRIQGVLEWTEYQLF